MKETNVNKTNVKETNVKETNVNKIPPLRSRIELEKQLAAQIAVGAIKSLEEAEEAGHIDALEYCAQMLFDNVRRRVASKKNLPLNIVLHLMEDRTPVVKFEVIQHNFDTLPEEYQNQVLNEIEYTLQQKDWGTYYNRGSSEHYCVRIIENIIATHYVRLTDHIYSMLAHKHAIEINKQNGKLSDDIQIELDNELDKIYQGDIKLIKYLQVSQYNPDKQYGYQHNNIRIEAPLRWLPKTCAALYTDKAPIRMLHLVHPDINVRKNAVEITLDMKVKQLRRTFPESQHLERFNTSHIKTEVYKIIAQDPDISIRRMLVNKINHEPTLTWMAQYDSDSLIRRKARLKAARAKKRAEYHTKYHERKNRGK